MNSSIFVRTGFLTVFGLSIALVCPDCCKGFGPRGMSTPTVTPGPAQQRSLDVGGSQRRVITSPRTPDLGGIQSGPGFGILLGPRRLIPERDGLSTPTVEVPEPEHSGITTKQPRKHFSRRIEKGPSVKLAKPRVPYLSELAMDIKPSLNGLVTQDPIKAVRVYEQALKQAMKGKDPTRKWEASTDLGHVYYLTGRLTQAAENYSRSADISKSQRDLVGEGLALRNLGAAFTASGEYDRAEAQNLSALDKLKSMARAKDAQMTLNNLGVLEKNRGLYPSATRYYEQGLRITGDLSEMRVLALRNLGNLYKFWGEYEKAVDNYKAYGKAAASLGKTSEAAEALLDEGSVYARQDFYDRAVVKVQQAIQIQSAAKIQTDWSKKLMGDLLLEMSLPTEAEPYITEAGYDSSAALLHLIKLQPQAAKTNYERLLDAATREQNLDEMFTAHVGLAKVYETTQDYSRAEHHYAEAVSITEEIRASLLPSERRNFFAEKISGFARSEPAKGLARVALKRNNPAAGIYAGEVTKAREFADNLSQRTERDYFDVPPELLEKEAELTNRLASLKTALSAIPRELDKRRFEEMSKQIKHEDAKRKEFVRALCENCREYCAVKYPQPVSLGNSRINDAEYVLLFDVLGDAVGTTLLKGKRVVGSYLVPWKSVELEKQIRSLRRPFEQAQLTKFSPELAQMFYEKLLAGILNSVPPGSRVTIIPDGALALLPFEALVVEGKSIWKRGSEGDYPAGLTYVGDRYSIAYYQSLTAMTLVRASVRHEIKRNRALVMADPVFDASDERLQEVARRITQAPKEDRERLPRRAQDMGAIPALSLNRLPESEKLGTNLKELLGASCDLYTGLACTKPAFLDKFGGKTKPYSAVVFATHGFAANDLPGIMEPALALTLVPQGIDGFLKMSEVAGMKMDVDIAALTACKTGLGMRLAGEGVMSMGRSFQAAGARSVLMSLWSVAERPSILLMEEFFREFAQSGDKLAAWTNARAHIRREGFEHPFFWASFILVGEAN